MGVVAALRLLCMFFLPTSLIQLRARARPGAVLDLAVAVSDVERSSPPSIRLSLLLVQRGMRSLHHGISWPLGVQVGDQAVVGLAIFCGEAEMMLVGLLVKGSLLLAIALSQRLTKHTRNWPSQAYIRTWQWRPRTRRCTFQLRPWQTISKSEKVSELVRLQGR